MKIKIAWAVPLFLCCVEGVFAGTLFFDDFLGTSMDPKFWKRPTWRSSTDGTFVGRTKLARTQFVCTPRPLPEIVNGKCVLSLKTYNPTSIAGHPSFFGDDVILIQELSVGQGISVTWVVRMEMPLTRGMVGGLFLYALRPGSNTLHDEVDFELLSNRPGECQSNFYNAEPLGAGHPKSHPFSNGSSTDWHVYRIEWTTQKLSWSVDGTEVRSETASIPAGPMFLHLNLWAPAADWAAAYDPAIQPVTQASLNQTYTMSVDSCRIESMEPSQTLPTVSSVSASPNPAQVGQQVIFTASTEGAQTFLWDFGDGKTAIGSEVGHAFASVGEYQVNLSASNSVGNASGSVLVTVGDPLDVVYASVRTLYRLDSKTDRVTLQAQNLDSSFDIKNFSVRIGGEEFSFVKGDLQDKNRPRKNYSFASFRNGNVLNIFLEKVSVPSLRVPRPTHGSLFDSSEAEVPILLRWASGSATATVKTDALLGRRYCLYEFGTYVPY